MKHPLIPGLLKLNRRPPNYKVNKFASSPEEIKLESSFQSDEENNEKKNQILCLQKKLKSLEKQLEQRDQEIESLQMETQKIVKERDAVSRLISLFQLLL